MVIFELKDAYPAEARPIEADFLAPQIAGRYLEHRQTVRRWSYFQYPVNGAVFTTDLKVIITDEIGRSFSYLIPSKDSIENADAMSRMISFGPTIDLCACSIEH